MDRTRIYVDFNEMLEHDLVLLCQEDTKRDSAGKVVRLYEGLAVHIYMDDLDEDGRPDNLLAEGVVERNSSEGWGSHVKWCCRIG